VLEVDDEVAEVKARARAAAEEAGVAGMRANAMRAGDFQRWLLAMHGKGLRLGAYGARGDGDSVEELLAEVGEGRKLERIGHSGISSVVSGGTAHAPAADDAASGDMQASSLGRV